MPRGIRLEDDVAALTSATLTDSSGGTASATLAAISGTYVQAEVRNSVASLVAQVNALRVDLAVLRSSYNDNG